MNSVWAQDVFSNRPEFAAGQDLVSRGNYPEAISVFREISQSSTSDDIRAAALFTIGSIYENDLDLPENAVDCYKDLILMYPESPSAPDALFNIGRIYYNHERYRDALKAFDDYMDRYPSGSRKASVKSWAESAERKSRKTPVIEKTTAPTTMTSGIRVLLTRKTETLKVEGSTALSVQNMDNAQTLFQGSGPLIFKRSGKKLLINGKPVDAVNCRVMHHGEWIAAAGKKYRGDVSIHLKSTGLMAVNHLDVESYLYGVVPKEMSPLWEPQALMAQAIASRTFALYIRDKHATADKLYDVEATTSSQVYGGFDAEKESARAAVDASRGMVLTYNGKLIISYFHASSGGQTESSLNVWSVDLPYLVSKEDSYSIEQTDTPWEFAVSYKDLTRIFCKSLGGKSVKQVIVLDKSPSGRIMNVLLTTDEKQVKLSGNSFRLAVGPVSMKSTVCDMTADSTGITLKGIGYGHGVGMSQHGAQRMALSGLACDAILKHYYKDVTIVRVGYF